MAAACTFLCLREPGEPMIVLRRRCRRGRDDENAVEGATNLGLQGTAARAKAVDERGITGTRGRSDGRGHRCALPRVL